MPYTIWNRGELVGESNLDYPRLSPRARSGEFLPTAYGESLIPVPPIDVDQLPPGTLVTEGVCTDLELRGPDGSVIRIEWIEIRDNDHSRALVCPSLTAAHAGDAPVSSTTARDFDAFAPFDDSDIDIDDFESDPDADWDGFFPRYEIDVRLVDDASVP
jgi:hypothetical protein